MEPKTSSRDNPLIFKRLALGFATFLAANPFVLYLLTESLFKSLLFSIASFSLVQLLYSFSRLKTLTAYIFNFIVLIALLIHAEVILERVFPEYVIKSLYSIEDGYYFNRPLLEERFQDQEYSAAYRTNIQGFRIPVGLDPYRSINRCDWLVLGDSFTQGAQVEFNQLYTWHLNERFANRVVLNAGISGLGIGQEYNYFFRDGYKYKPSLVILQLCSFNDFYNVEPEEATFTDRLMSEWSTARLLLSGIRYTQPSDLPLGRWTEPFQPDHLSNADFNIFYNESTPFKDWDLEVFKNYVKQFDHAVSSVGAELIITLIPTREQVEENALKEVLTQFSIAPDAVDMLRPNKLLADLTSELDIGFVDLLPHFLKANEKMFFEFDEHLTADGHKVVAEALGNFLELRHGKSSAKLLSKGFNSDRYPMYSADGSMISYQSLRDGNMEIFVADRNFESSRRLTSNSIFETHPSLSPDSSRIVFTEGTAETFDTKVAIMDFDGKNRQRLTPEDSHYGAIPTFSPSGGQVAYAGWEHDLETKTLSLPKILVKDLETQELTSVTDGRDECWRPVFSPNSNQLIYIKKTDDQFDLFAFDLLSGVERRLTDTPHDEWDPQFTPDSKHVVFAAHPEDNWDLFLLDLQDNSTIRLTQTIGHEWDPSVSPDGSTILFAGSFGFLEAVFSMPFPQ